LLVVFQLFRWLNILSLQAAAAVRQILFRLVGAAALVGFELILHIP
jgi:hypothetical protein